MEKLITQKVLVYVIRKNKLLVFRHIDFSYEEVGIQVPAGTVNDGENSRDAALRELQEETGFDCFEITSELGSNQYDISPYRNEIQDRHFFLARPTRTMPERWTSNEGEIHFEFFWIPLEHAHVLQSGQGSMIGYALENL